MDGLILGGAYLWREICVSKSTGLPFFALFYFVFEGDFLVSTSPQGAYIWRGDLTEAVTSLGGLYLEGLIHGGAYFRNFTVTFFEIKTPSLSCYHLLVYQTG